VKNLIGLRTLRRSLLFLVMLAQRYPRWVLSVGLLLWLVAISGLPRLKTVISVHELLPTEFSSVVEMRDLDRDFRVGRQVSVSVARDDAPMSEADLCSIRRWLSQRVMDDTSLIAVSSPFDLRRAQREGDRLNFHSVWQLNCESPSRDPNSARLAELRATPWSGLVVFPKREALLFELSHNEEVTDTRFGAFAPTRRTEIESSLRAALPAHLQVEIGGSGIYESFLVEGIQRYGLLNASILALVLLFCRWFTGTWRGGALYAGSLIITGSSLYGIIGWSGFPMDVLSNSLFMMTAVAALQDFLYLTGAVRASALQGARAGHAAFRRFALPCFFTSLTTMIGFGSLSVSSIDSVSRFGMWAALGALLEWFTLFMLLPAFVRVLPAALDWAKPMPCSLQSLVKLFLWIPRKPSMRQIWRVGLLAVFVAAAVASPSLRVFEDPKSMLPDTHAYREKLARWQSELGWEFAANLEFPEALPLAERQRRVELVTRGPGVVRVDDVSIVANWMSQGLDELDRAFVERELYESGRLRRYQTPSGRGRAIIYVATAEVGKIDALREFVAREVCPQRECRLVGELVAYSDFVRSIATTLYESLIVSVGLVALVLMGLIFVRLPRGLRFSQGAMLILASFWGPAAVLLILAATQIPLNMVTAICASVVVGLTGDNAIQFLFGRDRGPQALADAVEIKSEAAILTGAMMACLSLVFLMSYFQPPRTLGLLLALSFIVCLWGDLNLLRLLLDGSRRSGSEPSKTKA
jgi:predicted RND superfamily exporter protein